MKTEAAYSVDGIHIRDRSGRVVILRGCNLGGDSKLPFSPAGNPLSYDVSFTGRPFPESECDSHFERLAGWGFTFLRFVITWEAVEHAGPGLYDEEYLSYLRNILKKAEAWGISVFLDPHQDAWSRWTGGDGAPGWTLEAAGFDLDRITPTGAAFTAASGENKYRPMSWGLNYLRYANATMWTLFFAGNSFAPGRLVEGVPVQDWLQDHFIDAMRHTARRLKDCASIVGFGTLNEPHYGYIGLPDLNGHHRVMSASGAVPTAFEGMAAASGFHRQVKEVALAGMIVKRRKISLNPEGSSLFREGQLCPWREAGVWAVEEGLPVLKKPAYFATLPAGSGIDAGRPVHFGNDFLKPFQKRLIEAVSKKHEHYIFFVEGVPMAERPSWNAGDRIRSDGTPLALVEAFHWYEGLTLLFKRWNPWFATESETGGIAFGPAAAARSSRVQLARMAARPRSEGFPACLGEFGISFDMEKGRSYRTGNYRAQEAALGAWYDAVDASLLHSELWNYSASNTHESGDGWNGEDLSVWSASTGEGRAVRGFCRPYAMAVAGVPVRMHFDRKKRIFDFEWDASEGSTELYVPSVWYPEGWAASFSGGSAVLEEKPGEQRLFVAVGEPGRVSVRVSPCDRATEA